MSSPTTNTTAAPALQDFPADFPADLLAQIEAWRSGAATQTQNNSGGGDAVIDLSPPATGATPADLPPAAPASPTADGDGAQALAATAAARATNLTGSFVRSV